MFKVLSGSVATGDRLVSTATGAEDRVHGLFRLRGREHVAVDRVVAGDVAAVAKLSAATTGTLLAARRAPVSARELPERPPVYAVALRPVSQSDDDKLSSALTRLRAEDPTLHVDLTGSQAVLGASATRTSPSPSSGSSARSACASRPSPSRSPTARPSRAPSRSRAR
ncbi:hypothetical protein [Cellulosimicrobium cellulans]|uniref:hypothetical protein n=1 Tax=Cellulosimicrobium cellulans TaxID=1710 RepID=UPI003D76840D